MYSDCTRTLDAVEQAQQKKMLRAWRYDAEEQWHQWRAASAILAEGFELLRWSVLAASTIGPGTVIVCSKAGYQCAYDCCGRSSWLPSSPTRCKRVRLGYPSAAARLWEARCASSCKDKSCLGVRRGYFDRQPRPTKRTILWGRPKRYMHSAYLDTTRAYELSSICADDGDPRDVIPR